MWCPYLLACSKEPKRCILSEMLALNNTPSGIKINVLFIFSHLDYIIHVIIYNLEEHILFDYDNLGYKLL
jgi:hypothetical protein